MSGWRDVFIPAPPDQSVWLRDRNGLVGLGYCVYGSEVLFGLASRWHWFKGDRRQADPIAWQAVVPGEFPWGAFPEVAA